MTDYFENYFDLKTSSEAKQALISAWKPQPLGIEVIPITQALGRIIADDLYSSEDIPPFNRSTIDGYAVRAKDTFGATEALPAMLEIMGEVSMGQVPTDTISIGQAVKIWTGGALPKGADACVMVEYTQSPDENTVLVERPAAPGENVILKGEDIGKDRLVIEAGRFIRPYEVGAMAALGQTEARVVKRPKVAIVSTGDEIILPHQTPEPGQIRDINTYSLAASALSAGTLPITLGIAKDEYSYTRAKVERGLASSDIVLLSGGSSVGARDVAVKVLQDLGPPGVLVHGTSIKPGKPVIIAICNGKPVFGLPGHPVSALVTFNVFVKFAIEHLFKSSLPKESTIRWPKPTVVHARLSRNIASVTGREDTVRVRLRTIDGELWADPVLGKSGLISVLADSDGEILVPLQSEGLLEGTVVEVAVL